jgi:hypothetical protein
MNNEYSWFSDLRANGSDEAVAVEKTIAPESLEQDTFIPRDPNRKFIPYLAPTTTVPSQTITVTSNDLMNQGLENNQLSSTLNSDGNAEPTFISAMANSRRFGRMPKTIEEQLSMFKDEQKMVIDQMPNEAKEGHAAI